MLKSISINLNPTSHQGSQSAQQKAFSSVYKEKAFAVYLAAKA
jgi:hypothetical protein